MTSDAKSAISLKGTSIFDGVEKTDPIRNSSGAIKQKVSSLSEQTIGSARQGVDKARDGVGYVKSNVTKFTDTISEYRSETLDKISSGLGALTNDYLSSDDIMNAVNLKNGKIDISPDKLLNRVSNDIGLDVHSLSDFKNDLASKVFDQFNDATNGLLGDYFTLDGTKLSFDQNQLKTGELGIFIGILDKLNIDIFGEDGAKDATLNDVMFASLLTQSVQYGMVESIEPLYNQFTSSTRGQHALVNCVGVATNNGNYYVLKELTRLMSVESIEQVAIKYPTLGSDFLDEYSLDEKDHVGMYSTLAVDIKNLLIKLSGRKFWMLDTNYGEIPDLTMSSRISQDATTVLIEDKDLAVIICANGRYSDTDAVSVFKDDFTNAVIITE